MGGRFGEPGGPVTHTVTIVNTGVLSDAYDLALGAPVWTSTVPFTRSPLLLPQQPLSVGLTVTIPADAGKGDDDQVTLTVTSVYSPVHAAQVVLRTAVAHRAYLPLVSRD